MQITSLPLEGLLLIEPKVFKDPRGYFFESYNEPVFEKLSIPFRFEQDNQSLSEKNVVRGLHFQNPPYEQGKLVRVINGAVLDVVVDIRKKSKTYGKHFSLVMSDADFKMLWIPPGFAHGFTALENNTIFLYKCTHVYNKEAEGGILYNDTDLAIDWNTNQPNVSEKDMQLPPFKNLQSGF